MKLNLILIGLVAIAFFSLGLMVDRLYLTLPPGEFKLEETATPQVPTVDVHSIGDGYLNATVKHGEVRLSAGEVVAVPDPQSGELALPLYDALVDYDIIPIPEGAQFVASQNGTRYYPLGHSGVRRINPENRVFFFNAEEAEQSGYSLAE